MRSYYKRVEVRQEVYQELLADKAALERTFKKNISWSHYGHLLVKSGASKRLVASDIDTNMDVVIREIRGIFEPRRLRDGR